MYLPASKACEFYGVCFMTLKRWRIAGKINVATSPSGKILYECLIKDDTSRKNYCYCSVKNESEREILRKQVEILKGLYPDYIMLKDIGTGTERENFTFLIDEAIKNHVSTIVVLSPDILYEGDFSLLEFLFSRCKTDILIPKTSLGKEIEDKNKILSILSRLKGQ